jgi:hypothetical protein
MSPNLPVVSGDKLIRALGKLDYVVVRQRRHSTTINASLSQFRFTTRLLSALFAGFFET